MANVSVVKSKLRARVRWAATKVTSKALNLGGFSEVITFKV